MHINFSFSDRKLFLLVGGAIVIAILGALFLAVINSVRRTLEWDRPYGAQADARAIVDSLINYEGRFGAPPVGGNAEVMAALGGKNPGQIAFISPSSMRLNAQGEYVDPWRRPFHIDVSNPKAPTVYSFGKNGVDEGGAVGSDDIASWRWFKE